MAKHVLTPAELKKFMLWVVRNRKYETIQSQRGRTVVSQNRDTKALFAYWFSTTVDADIFPQIPQNLLERCIALLKVIGEDMKVYMEAHERYFEHVQSNQVWDSGARKWVGDTEGNGVEWSKMREQCNLDYLAVEEARP